MTFASRQDAGRKLGQYLLETKIHVDVVAGLPRGGVIVAAETAHVLQRPLDVLIVRKIGHPLHREFAVGALAEGGVLLLNEAAIGPYANLRKQLNEIIREETIRLREYRDKFHGERRSDFQNKSVLIVDDGLATGSTMEAAALSARKQGATRVIIAVPVASPSGVDRLTRVADSVESLLVDADFDAVGRYYREFSQTTDDEVLEVLKAEQTHTGY